MKKGFDFIIVGAGSAGCVLAERLTASGENRVLLLDAGPKDRTWTIHKAPVEVRDGKGLRRIFVLVVPVRLQLRRVFVLVLRGMQVTDRIAASYPCLENYDHP